MYDEKVEPAAQTTPERVYDPELLWSEQPTTPYSDEDIDLDLLRKAFPLGNELEQQIKEQQIKEQRINDNWSSIIGKQQDNEQMLNSVFNKQAQIALNLNQVREDALNNLRQSKSKKFKDDTEEYVKSIGMKVLRDNDPDFADTVEEARVIDKNFNPNRANKLEEAKNRIIEKMRAYESKPNAKGWNTMIKSISKDLRKFGYIYEDGELKKLTRDEIDKLTQDPFPYLFKTSENLDNMDVDELEKYLTYRVNVSKRLSDKVKAHKTDLQQQLNEYKDNNTFTTNEKVALDNKDEFYATAKPTLKAYEELIDKYSHYLTPEVISDLEKNVKQINDYINDARLKGVSAGEMKGYTKLVNKVRENVKNNYQNILNKMQAYSNSVSAEDAILNEIKSLASYEQYSQLPPAIFEKLPDEMKNKVMRLMELKAKLQKQQGKTKKISNKYKEPPSPNNTPKILNPMLNKGYSIHNKVAQHNVYNSAFA